MAVDIIFDDSLDLIFTPEGELALDSDCCCDVCLPCFDDPTVTVRLFDWGDETTDPENPIDEEYQECCAVGNDYPCTRIGECHWKYGPTAYCAGLTIEIDVQTILETVGPPATYKILITVTIREGATVLIVATFASTDVCFNNRTTQWANITCPLESYTENDTTKINCLDPFNVVFNPT